MTPDEIERAAAELAGDYWRDQDLRQAQTELPF